MTQDIAASLAAYARFYETLTRGRVPQLRDIVNPGVGFKDPFNDVRGVDAMIRVVTALFDHGTPRFEVLDQAVSPHAGYLLWRCTIAREGHLPRIVEGMSEIRFDGQGRAIDHVDHWDAGAQFYERLPVIGTVLRLIKRRRRVDELR
jgi:hypothetical protein